MLLLFCFFFSSHSLTTLGNLDLFIYQYKFRITAVNWNRNLTDPVSWCNSAEICVDLYSIPPCIVSRSSKTAVVRKWLQKQSIRVISIIRNLHPVKRI